MKAQRYSLVGGDAEPIWVIDNDPCGWDRNPLFVLAARDKAFARKLVNNLNAIGGDAVSEEAGHATAVTAPQ
jgi:hypothetical protein